jgi:hypothetical protein
MIHTLSHACRWARLRAPLLALAVLAGACDNSDNVATTAPSDPTIAEEFESPAAFAVTNTHTGTPYGPIGLWKAYTGSWNPAPFTGSHNHSDPGGIIAQIAAARLLRHRLVLAMTGGLSTKYTTNGQFDFAKWQQRINLFNTTAIKAAVAAGVADGTIIGNQLIDEPETRRWGGVITKATIDQMARYAKTIFPTLPMGLNHGPPAYRWRATERYQALDYAIYQYNHWVTLGNVVAWRDAVLAQARLDGVTPAFSLNVLDGGVQDRTASYTCTGPGQAGRGTYQPNCRMTADQVRTWGRAIGTAGCTMHMWRYDQVYMANSANQSAFRDVAALLASQARRSCARAVAR